MTTFFITARVLWWIVFVLNIASIILNTRTAKRLRKGYEEIGGLRKQFDETVTEYRRMNDSMITFPIQVLPCEDGDGFMAYVREFDCYGDGSTPEEAINDVKEVLYDIIFIHRENMRGSKLKGETNSK